MWLRISDMNDQENVRKIMDDWVPDILTELESDNSRLFKEEILWKNLDNETLKRVLKAALDPYTQYYQRKIPKYSRKEDQPIKSLNWALSGLNQLTSRDYTGNAAIDHLQKILSLVTEENAEVIKRKEDEHKMAIEKGFELFGRHYMNLWDWNPLWRDVMNGKEALIIMGVSFVVSSLLLIWGLVVYTFLKDWLKKRNAPPPPPKKKKKKKRRKKKAAPKKKRIVKNQYDEEDDIIIEE